MLIVVIVNAGEETRDLDARGRMCRKLRLLGDKGTDSLRSTGVEPVIGQIKGIRQLDCFLI